MGSSCIICGQRFGPMAMRNEGGIHPDDMNTMVNPDAS